MSTMPWHEIPEDYEESPDYEEHDFKLDQAGNGTAYTEYRPPKMVKPAATTTIDDDIRLFRERMEKPSFDPMIRRITLPTMVEFNFKPRIDTSQDTRNRLYIGNVETQTQNFMLWGFDSWQEFRDHVHPTDLASARELYDLVATEMALMFNRTGMFKIRLWTIHDEIPRAGFYVLSVDSYDTNTRNIISTHDNRRYLNADLTQIKINKLYYNPKKWMEI